MNNYFKIVLFFIHTLSLYPVGAGIAIYRNTPEGIEILLVKDPFQKKSWRQGFEFPAGVIGDFGHRTIDQLDGKKIDAFIPDRKKEYFSYLLYSRRYT